MLLKYYNTMQSMESEITRFSIDLSIEDNEELKKMAKEEGRNKKAQAEWVLRDCLRKRTK